MILFIIVITSKLSNSGIFNTVDELARFSQYFNLQAFLIDSPLNKTLIIYSMLELSITVSYAAIIGRNDKKLLRKKNNLA